MTEYTKKIIILSSVLALIVILGIVVCFVDIDLKILKFNSIKSIIAKHEEVIQAETKLKQKESEYNTAVSKINTAKSEFETAKTKYEAISDETIEIIKEATTEENYNIEYMWIRLGNYATKNNLKIVMVEPGGTFTEEETTEKDGTTKTKTTTTTSTSTENKTTAENTTEKTKSENNDDTTTKEGSTQDTLFKIQVTGSYLNVSDFVFEVENDKALKFKLDNISMDYVSGTTIKATFNVKNLIINK